MRISKLDYIIMLGNKNFINKRNENLNKYYNHQKINRKVLEAN